MNNIASEPEPTVRSVLKEVRYLADQIQIMKIEQQRLSEWISILRSNPTD